MDHLVPVVMSLINFEVGGHNSASKGRIHVIPPLIGSRIGTLRAGQQSYNDVHGWYRARMEQLFAHLWHWGLVRTIWHGGPNELHESVRVLLHFHAILHWEAGLSPSLWSMGPCPTSCLE